MISIVPVDVSLVLNIVAFTGAALLTGWSFFTTIWNQRRGHNKDVQPHKFYEDEDGEATEESLAKSRDVIPKLCTILFAILGLGVAIGYVVKVTLDSDWEAPLGLWLRLGAWVRCRK